MHKNMLTIFILPIIFFIGLAVFIYFLLGYIQPSPVFYSYQLILSKTLVFSLFAYIITVLLKHKIYVKNILKDFFSEPVSPNSLSIFRIGFFTFLTGMYWYQHQNAGILQNTTVEKVPLPFTEWYMHLLPFNYSFYSLAYYVASTIALLSALGIYYRYIAWLNIIFSFYIIGLPMFLGKLFYMQIWFWGSCFLAFAPAANTLSLDYLIKKISNRPINYTPHYKYGVALKWLWLHLGIIYFFSAIYKLLHTGLYWALSNNMINQMQIEWLTNYYTIPAFRLDYYPLMAKVGGLYIIFIELLFIFLLFSVKTRWLALVGGLSVHWGAAYFLHLSMGDLQFMYVSLLCIILIKSKPLQTNNIFNYELPDIKKPMVIGMIFFILNSICGVFNINSWPFSAYPSHSANVKDTFTRIEFETAHLSRFDLDSIAVKNKFRKDNYYNFSDEAVNSYYKGDSVLMKKRIMILWKNWQLNNPELKEINTPLVYIIETPVAPEKKHQIIKQMPIYY